MADPSLIPGFRKRKTNCGTRVAKEHEKMKAYTILQFTALGLWLATGSLTVHGREPARNLEDLAKIEAKVEEVSRKVMPATVALLSMRTGSSGSGVIATEDGLILTAAHVVQGSDEVLVVFPDGKQVQGKVLGANYSKDIAMVQIKDAGKWPHAEIGESKQLEAGDWVIALGHSGGFDAARTPPVRFGCVTSKGPGDFLSTDCTIIGGDSGGPLFNLDGKIIGVHSHIGESLTNNNHAGIDGFREDWDRIHAGETWGKLSLDPSTNPEKPVLGVSMANVRGVKGVVITGVAPGSPAADAGVRAGDAILSVDGDATLDCTELKKILAKHRAGDNVKLDVLRDTTHQEITVTLRRLSELYEQH